VKIQYNGAEYDAEEVDVKLQSELWNQYELADGGQLKIKTILVRVLKAKDGKGGYVRTDKGEMLYITDHQTFVRIQ